MQSFPLSLALGAVVAAVVPASAAILVDDTFDAGINPGYVPMDMQVTATVVTDGSAMLDGNALLYSSISNNRVIIRDFESVSLAGIGDFIEVELDYRLASMKDVRDGVQLTFGGNGLSTGMLFDPTAGNNQGKFVYEGRGDNDGRFDTIQSGTSAQSTTLRLEVISAMEFQLSASFNGDTPRLSKVGEFGVDRISPLIFDKLEFGLVGGGNTGDVYVDNVVVTSNAVVPEPATLSLAGVGLFTLAARRRKPM
jgi:hypothetical protein